MPDRPTVPPGGHYFSSEPAVGSRRREVEVDLAEGRRLVFETDRGVFSPDGLDRGTRVLLAEAPPPRGRVLVDLGAGWGAIAVAMALRASEDAVVWAVEVNERARDLCRSNAERNGVAEMVRVIDPGGFPEDAVIDTIWSNPPIRIGKRALHDLLDRWLGRLAPDGTAELVVHRHLGSDSLQARLADVGHPVQRRASHGGYRVLSVGPARGEAGEEEGRS